MDLDDSQDKIRRNLVVYCAAILVLALLQVSAAEVTQRFLGNDKVVLSPVRFTVVSGLILTYLCWRFFTDQKLSEIQTKATNARHTHQLNLVTVGLETILKMWGKHVDVASLPKWIDFGQTNALVEVEVDPYLPDGAENLRLAFNNQLPSPTKYPWVGHITINSLFRDPAVSAETVPGPVFKTRVKYVVPRLSRLAILIKSWAAYFKTDACVETGLPRVLACFAAFTLLYKLVMALI